MRTYEIVERIYEHVKAKGVEGVSSDGRWIYRLTLPNGVTVCARSEDEGWTHCVMVAGFLSVFNVESAKESAFMRGDSDGVITIGRMLGLEEITVDNGRKILYCIP